MKASTKALPEAKSAISNVKSLPNGAQYTWVNGSPVTQSGKRQVKVTYPDGSSDTVDVTVTYQNFRVWYNGLGVELRREDRGTSIETRQLLHCNWGWDGRGDGYFTAGLFAPQQAQSYDFPTLGTTDNHNYRFVVTQCTNTRPQHYPQ